MPPHPDGRPAGQLLGWSAADVLGANVADFLPDLIGAQGPAGPAETHRRVERAARLAHARFSQSVLAQASMNAQGVITAVNGALCELFGYRAEQLEGRPFGEFLLADDVSEATASWCRTISGQVPTKQVVRNLRRADGQYRQVRLSMFSVRSEEGAVESVEAALEDITVVARAEQELRASEARWRSLALRSTDVAFLADAGGDVFFVTPSLLPQFGYPEEAVLGRSGFTFFHRQDEPAVRAFWQDVLPQEGAPLTCRARVRHADGRWRWVQLTATSWLSHPDIGAVIANVTDITEILAAQGRLEAHGDIDALTGLLTRSALVRRLEAALLAPEAAAGGLLLLDLDQFRRVNTVHGHARGDEALVAVSHRLGEWGGPGSTVARIGGDRFAILRPDVPGPALHDAAGRLAALVAEPLALADRLVHLTASVGAVALGGQGEPAASSTMVLQSAELALRSARALGPGRAQLDDAVSRAAANSKCETLRQLRAALDNRDIVAYYQPIVDIASGRPIGVEALARWQHPYRGLLLPADFIELAEESGLIVDLGRQLLLAACQAGARWARYGSTAAPFTVSVNLSANQLVEPTVVEMVRGCLDSTGLAPDRLVLEVTETAVVADVDSTTAVLTQLRAFGVGLAVDDFGTGYSSLTYLKRFPLTALKIDRSFVAGLCSDADDSAIVTSLIRLADSTGLACVAEGVETLEQAAVLDYLGCTSGQGWLWGKAMRDSDLDDWLLAGAWQSARQFPSTASNPRRTPSLATFRSPAPQVLTRMLALQAQGASLHTIAAALNAEGCGTLDGKRRHSRSVARALGAPFRKAPHS